MCKYIKLLDDYYTVSNVTLKVRNKRSSEFLVTQISIVLYL